VYPVKVVNGDVWLLAEPIFASTVLPEPAEDVIVTFVHLPSTTVELLAGMDPEVKDPALAMNVPPSEEFAALGVAATFMRFLPQITMVWPVLPVIAEWFAAVDDGHGPPAVDGEPSTKASNTRKE